MEKKIDETSGLQRPSDWPEYTAYVDRAMKIDMVEPVSYTEWHKITNNTGGVMASGTDRVLQGEFSFANGRLEFLCHTKNVGFSEVLEAITALRDECQRQIDNQTKCPFHT